MRFTHSLLLFVLCLLLSVCVLTSCRDVPEEPGDAATDAVSSGGTSGGTDPEPTPGTIETPTEAVTESETMPYDPSVLSFGDGDALSGWVDMTGGASEFIEDEGRGFLSLTSESKSKHARLTVSYADWVKSLGAEPLPVGDAAFIVVRARVENGTSDKAYMRVQQDKGRIVRDELTASYDPDETDWQNIVFCTEGLSWSGSVGKLEIEVFRSTDDRDQVFVIDGITLCRDRFDLLETVGMTQYLLGFDSDMTVEMHDPAVHEKLTAPDEDASVLLWFDHITEKTAQSTVTDTGLCGYTVQLAQNEIEDCQFFVSPAGDRRIRAELSVFTDKDGRTVDAQLYYMYYTNVAGQMVPDAIPPVTGPIEVGGGRSQGFVIRVKTASDTPAGLYEGHVDIFDDETGSHIKTASVSVRVFGFALADETRLRTAMDLTYWKIYHTYPSDSDFDAIAVNYYKFLLENRINAYELPFGVRDSRAWDLIPDPRVNSFRVPGVEEYRQEEYESSVFEIFTEHGFLDKAYFYRLDEPCTQADLNELKRRVENSRKYYPGCRFMSPCYVNIGVGQDDQIEFMAPLVSIWCYKFYSFTPRELAFAGGAYLQTPAQDEQYGEFADRMETYRNEGYEVWAYFTSAMPRGYANFMCDDDGTGAIVSVWQCKLYGCTGLLYWGTNAWNDDMLGDVRLMAGANVRGWGDGILLYSGAPFGLDTPISSLRLETIRDGIEDYQLLCMLEDLCGKEESDRFVHLVTTSALTWTNDDAYLAAVRIMLRERVEAALAA